MTVHAFGIMPNHYHLLCETPQGGLRTLMRHINGDYAQAFNSRHHRVGHLWQGRYKAILVDDGTYMLECTRYIHLNPNRSRLTRPAERYRWSSYRNYVASGSACVPWVSTERTLKEFDGDRERYRRWIETGKGEKTISPFERAVAGLVLGGDAFVARVTDLLNKRVGSAEEPSLRYFKPTSTFSPDAIEADVHRVFAEETPRRQRRLLYYALRKFSPLGVSAIARRYDRTPSTVSMAVRQLDEESSRNKTLVAGMELIAAKVATRGASLST